MLNPLMQGFFDPAAGYPHGEWNAVRDKYAKYRSYYSGEVLDELVSGTARKKYPVAINIARMIAMINAYAVLGEWRDNVFSWKSPDDPDNVEFLEDVGRLSKWNSLYTSQMLSYQIYGGCVFGVKKNPLLPTKVMWTAIPVEAFFPVFNSHNNELLEAIVSYQITGREAKLLWNTDVRHDTALYSERWSRNNYEIWVDDKMVRSGATPAGEIPFVYIPRVPEVGESYGISAIDTVLGIQDEVNLRVSDLGDAVKAETHKEIITSNLPGGIDGIRRGKGFIHLGMGFGDSEPKVHAHTRAEVPAGAQVFVETLLDFSRYLSNTPPVSYGKDEGSQRSAETLVVRMWPLIKMAEMSRTFLGDGLSSLAAKTIAIASESGVKLVQGAYHAPDFPPTLPRQREQVVNEVVQLTGIQRLSTERALEMLDVPEEDREEELQRIQTLIEEERKHQQASLKSDTNNQETLQKRKDEN